MTKYSNKYERLVAKLIDNIKNSPHRNISEIRSGANNKIKGVCGQAHQIDVSFIDHSFDKHKPTLVLIECKRYSKPIDLEHVKILKATLDDILRSDATPCNAKAMIVTTQGARKGAQRFADYYGIIIEVLPHNEENFTFRYENIIEAGISISPETTINATPTVENHNEYEILAEEGLKEVYENEPLGLWEQCLES